MSNSRFGFRTRKGEIRSFIEGSASSNDPDAQAFITAAGITDSTQQSAINDLVINLKINNLWTKFNAIYPMVGGTATTHKFNLKNPADTDAAFRLSFIGGWTHSANGALPNGTNANADTFLNVNTTLSLTTSHISYYSRTNIAENRYDMGAAVDPSSYLAMLLRNIANNFRSIVYTGTANDASNTDSRGWFCSNRTSVSVFNSFKNLTKTHNLTQVAISKPNRTVYLGGLSFATPIYSNKQCAFATIGEGLTDVEAAALYNSIQAFQTTLGRQV